MNPYLLAGGLGAILLAFTVGVWFGKDLEQGKQAKVQVELIKQDGKKIIQIEAKNDTRRKTKVDDPFKIVEKQSPAWVDTALPDSVADGLCRSVRCD